MNRIWIRRAWERKGFSGKIAWFLLLPFSGLFFIAVMIRNLLYRTAWKRSAALERPVISVGNLTVGGTGKTPSCLWLARELIKRGLKVAILSRGYKGNASAPIIVAPTMSGPVYPESDGELAAAGDEPFMMARLHGQTVGVGRERYKSAQQLLGQYEVDVFLLDDGFQHRQLKRDVDVVLLGSECDGWLLPCGPFREPRNALRRADYFLITGAEDNWKQVLNGVGDKSWFSASLDPAVLVGFESNAWKEYPLSLLYRSRVLAVTGIGNPERFYQMIRDCEADIVDILEFPDHHGYSSSDWQQINRAGRDVDVIVTTEKDIVKLVRFPFAKEKLLALRVRMNVDHGERLVEAIVARIQKNPQSEPLLPRS